MGEVRKFPGNKRTGKVVAAGGEDPRSKLSADRKTKRVTNGNSPCDVEWLIEQAEYLTEIPKDEIPDDVYWDVLLMWDGDASEVNPAWFEEFFRGRKRRCTGRAYIRDERGGYILDREWVRLMRPCLVPPHVGKDVCSKHGGELGHVKAAAQRRLGMAAERAAETLINMTRTRDENNEPIDHKNRISAANSVLDRTGVKAGVDVDVNIPGYRKVLDNLFGDDSGE